MEGLLTRCRTLSALAACSLRHCRYIIHKCYHRAPGRGQRLVLSRMFQPQNLREDQVLSLEGRASDLTCKSQRLMLQVGLILPASPGCYHLMPYTVRAVEKLVRVIDQEMQAIGGQKINMPSLSPAELWRATSRWDLMGRELLRLRDRHGKEYCLGPTHEEAVTALVASQKKLSYKQLPLLLYQVTRKFRDEPRPRFGLLRGREFYMKDMYTFDSSSEAAQETYGLVCDAYCRLFDRLGVTRILAAAIEVLSTEDCIRWPRLLAPYQVCVIPPKKGSKETAATEIVEKLYDDIMEAVPQLRGEVLLDDRTHLTIGNRLKDANKLGYPFVIIAGKRALEDPAHFEVWSQNTGEVVFLTKEGVMELLTGVHVV